MFGLAVLAVADGAEPFAATFAFFGFRASRLLRCSRWAMMAVSTFAAPSWCRLDPPKAGNYLEAEPGATSPASPRAIL